MNNIKKLVDTHSKRLLEKKNVIGVAVGQKWTNGQNTNEDALIILVEKKEELDRLSKNDHIESEIDGVKTDVVGRVGQIKKQDINTGRVRPITTGHSCGHYQITAGTIGGIFLDRENELIILSNNHVLANENRGLRRKREHPTGDQIVQPGRIDGGRTGTDSIAFLKWYRPLIKRGRSFDAYNWQAIYNYNLEDSATALIKPGTEYSLDIPNIGTPAGWNDEPTMGMELQKTGRTTGHTKAKIIGLHATVQVQYDMGVLDFKDQILTADMSRGGDSGSLVLDADRNIVGLLFAGSDSVTVHNPIKYVRAAYGLQLPVPPTPIEEISSITIVENGEARTEKFSIENLDKLTKLAKTNAQKGTTTEIRAYYKSQPK